MALVKDFFINMDSKIKILIGILIGICGITTLCLIFSHCSSYSCCYCFDLICVETGFREVTKDTSQKIVEIHKIQVLLEMYYQMHGRYPGISGKDSWKETKEILIKENLLAPEYIFYEPEYWVSENRQEYVLKVLLNTHREELDKDVDGYPFGFGKVWCGVNGEKEREYCIKSPPKEVIIITDKTEYEQGEIVKIKLTNLGKETIKIQKIGKCHLFEVFDSNGKRISIDEPNCELFEIYHSPQYIKPNETKVIDFWDQTIYENQKKKQVLPDLYKIKAFGTETKIRIKAKGVIIRTDKAEYKQGEKVKITVTNKLNIPIIFAATPRCGSSFWSLEKKINDKWKEIAYYIPCLWEAPDFHYTRLDPNQSLEDIWHSNVWSWPEKWYIAKPGIYRIRFDYVIPKVIKTEKLGNLICEKLPEELEKLLKSGEWVKTGNETCEKKVRVGSEEKPCTPPTCGCGCIAKDVWLINNVARIDIDYWYCHGDMDKYWIKYQNTSYLCFPEYVKKYHPMEYHIEKRFFRKLGKLQREAVYAEFKVEPLFSKPHDNLTLPIDFLKCKKDKDCILGEKCGQVCFNKEFKEWYDKNVGVCAYKPVRSIINCGCIENKCSLISCKGFGHTISLNEYHESSRCCPRLEETINQDYLHPCYPPGENVCDKRSCSIPPPVSGDTPFYVCLTCGNGKCEIGEN
ncbi:MAG: hypothetical protein DRP08_06245, partial [Candidatus Aenigmatarchaeota archaeon]